jgi:hypothetical protein
MMASDVFSRRLVAALIVAMMGLLAVGSRPPARHLAVAQESVALYRSEVFDYFFFYDAAIWEIEEQASEPGSDFVRLTDGEVFVDYWAFDAPGMTAGECINTVVDALASEPSVIAVESLVNQGSPPHPQAFGALGSVQLVVTIEGADGRFKLATDERCEEIIPGQAFLYTSINVPAEVFNQTQSLDRTPWIKGFLPRDEQQEQTAPIPVLDASGSVRGTLAANPNCAEGSLLGIARAVDGDFVIDPLGFAAAYETGETVSVTFDAWLFPSAGVDQQRVLTEGDVGLFQLEVGGHFFDLYYTPPSGAPVLLGQEGGPCAGGGGGSPILIDLE